MAIFKVTTRWTEKSRNTPTAIFDRHHERRAASISAAVAMEKKHNDLRMREGMRKEGFSWQIVAVERIS